jgi:hypothetical protein
METTNINLDFGMFTHAGESAVYGIIVAAEVAANNLTPDQVLASLERLAKQPDFSEATDTAVREAVFEALGFFK